MQNKIRFEPRATGTYTTQVTGLAKQGYFLRSINSNLLNLVISAHPEYCFDSTTSITLLGTFYLC